MKILGLTGSIGMGKSTAAAMLRRQGIPVHDADRTVHDLMAAKGPAVCAIAKHFPQAVTDGRVDRQVLGGLVFGRPDQLKKLESILHPLVRQAERRFLASQRRAGRSLVVVDVPLLFETGGQKRCHAVAVVSAPAFVQQARVLRRPGMSQEKFRQILSRQMPDGKKRRLARWVIPSGLGKAVTFRALKALVKDMRSHA